MTPSGRAGEATCSCPNIEWLGPLTSLSLLKTKPLSHRRSSGSLPRKSPQPPHALPSPGLSLSMGKFRAMLSLPATVPGWKILSQPSRTHVPPRSSRLSLPQPAHDPLVKSLAGHTVLLPRAMYFITHILSLVCHLLHRQTRYLWHRVRIFSFLRSGVRTPAQKSHIPRPAPGPSKHLGRPPVSTRGHDHEMDTHLLVHNEVRRRTQRGWRLGNLLLLLI